MNSLSPITQIFNFPMGIKLSADDNSAIQVNENPDDLQQDIRELNNKIQGMIKSGSKEVYKLEFKAETQISSDGKSIKIGSFRATTKDQVIKLDLSYERYEAGIKSITLSSPDDIDSFNYSVKSNNKTRDEFYKQIATKLFEHFNSQLAISYADQNQNHRIENTQDNLERLETSPFSLIESMDDIQSDGKSVKWNHAGYYTCSDGDNPISFRNNSNPNHSQEMTVLLQKLGFKNASVS